MPSTDKPKKRKKHGFLIGLVCLIFLCLSAIGWIRLQQDIVNQNLVVSWTSQAIWIYLLVYGTCWGLAGLAAAVSFWMNPRWMKYVGVAAILFFPFTFWIEKLFLQKSPSHLVNWPFDTGVTLAWIILAGLALRRNLRYRFIH